MLHERLLEDLRLHCHDDFVAGRPNHIGGKFLHFNMKLTSSNDIVSRFSIAAWTIPSRNAVAATLPTAK